MVLIKSLFDDIPSLPDTNFHHLLFNREDQKAWPDFTVQIDALTGRRRTYREFLARVRDGATALGSPIADGGLGLTGEDSEIVGIMSDNSMASFASA